MLRLRVITAVILSVVYVAVVLLLKTGWFAGLLSAVIFLGALEWADLSGLDSIAARVVYAGAIVTLGGGGLWSGVYERPELYALATVWWLGVVVWLVAAAAPRARTHAPSSVWLLLGPAVLLPALFALVRIHDIHPTGPLLVLYVTSVVWVADIGAYFAGRRWGRRKLAPHISPGKSWEGALGAILLATVYGLLGGWGFDLDGVLILGFALLVGVAAAFSIAGDLLESCLKRSADRKDSGRLLPGHGGVLDRLDSLFAAAPVLAMGIVSPFLVQLHG